jgi:ApaG protein
MNLPRIEIKTQPQFEPEQSSIADGQYFYSYRIRIRNLEGQRCQLISRHWLITDANGHKQEVVGDGVVGQQPVIEPGREFSYTSGCLLETPVGTMEGYYVMCTDDGEEFHAPIAPFLLSVPGTVN